jgi:hypothetical protein
MAVNTYTAEHARFTLFYRQNENGVLVQLPFHLIDIDGRQFYEERSYLLVNKKGERLKGSAFSQVILDRNQGLPIASQNDKSVRPCYRYGGY